MLYIKNCPYCNQYPYVRYEKLNILHRFEIHCQVKSCSNSRKCVGYGLDYNSARTKSCRKWNKIGDKNGK